MIIDLKLGSIKAREIAEAMCAELLTLSANAPDREIERITSLKLPRIHFILLMMITRLRK